MPPWQRKHPVVPCPYCQSPDTYVTHSSVRAGKVILKRRCGGCYKPFWPPGCEPPQVQGGTVMKALLATLVLALLPSIVCAAPGKATLTWNDNSDNEAEFDIERKDAPCADATAAFTQIA